MKWPVMVKVEPRLRDVEQLAAEAHRSGMEWKKYADKLNAMLRPLVGFGATEATLRTNSADRAARDHLTGVRICGTAADKRRRARRWQNKRLPWEIDDANERAAPLSMPSVALIPPIRVIDHQNAGSMGS